MLCWISFFFSIMIYLINITNIYGFYWTIATGIDLSFIDLCHRNCFVLNTNLRL